ncbi:MAG: sulfatase-like hydrolase/transferase [Fimbriimonadaceae bacterium]|nr:sulfatase-like hydrolase/transferase [Fimbriimonadaceae bacterium]
MARRPNILLITSDQQHYSCLGATDPVLQTPALDRLCAEGQRGERAYTCNPTCSPTRASLITGLYPSVHGCWTLGTKLPEDVPTIGDALHGAGYHTALLGKAHFQPLGSRPSQTSLEAQPTLRDLAFWRQFHGPWYGFDHCELARNHADEAHAGQHYGAWLEDHGLTNWQDYFEPWPPQPGRSKRLHHWDLPAELHYTTWTAERTIADLERCAAADQPFFTWASFHDPHPPYLVSAPWSTLYDAADMQPGRLHAGELERLPPYVALAQQERPDYRPYVEQYASHGCQSHRHDEARLRADMAVYYGMISFMDQQIGRILEALDRLGQAEQTLVVFTSDHGHYLGHHGLVAKGPFHFDDGIKVPFIVRWPGEVAAGSVNRDLQSLVDLPTTFLAAAGLEIPGLHQGRDLAPSWRGEGAVRDHLICENRHQPTRLHLHTLVTEQHKITVFRGQPWGEIYDLAADPGETRNLWDEPSAQGLKCELLRRFVEADMAREPTRCPRIAHA